MVLFLFFVLVLFFAFLPSNGAALQFALKRVTMNFVDVTSLGKLVPYRRSCNRWWRSLVGDLELKVMVGTNYQYVILRDRTAAQSVRPLCDCDEQSDSLCSPGLVSG